ncbi:PilZ domain-containing protein [Myxococcota bacterium]
MNDRRRALRVLIRRIVDVSWEHGHGVAWGRDISLDGLYVQSHRRPDPGADVHLRVRFRRAGSLSVSGRVCRTDETGFAVRFSAIGQVEGDTLRKVLQGA